MSVTVEPLSSFATLAEGKAYFYISGVILTSNEMGVLFDKHPGNLSNLETLESSNESVRIFLTRFRSDGRFDFRNGDTGSDGDQLQGKLADLVAAGKLTQAFVDDVLLTANPKVYPHKNATEHDFAKAKGTMIYKQVTPKDGWLKITVDASVSGFEAHAPQIHADIQGVKRRVAGFERITESGTYLAQVPMQYGDLYVDNCYGAL